MNTLFSTFETNVDSFLDGFLVYLAKRYRTDLAKTRADWASYKNGTLELMDDPKTDPVATAKQITKLTDEESSSSSEEEIKTRVEGLDSEGPEPEAPKASESEEEVIPVKAKTPVKPAKAPAKTPVKPTKTPVKPKKEIVVEEESSESSKESSESSDLVVEEDDSEAPEESEVPEESEAPPPKKGKKIVVEEESSESIEESEAPPPKKVAKKVEKKPAAKKAPAMQLSDTPKSKDLTAPKGVKFVKGTNNVVFKDKVVAMFTKNGIVPLGSVQIKALTTKEFPYEKWDAAKIKKTWK